MKTIRIIASAAPNDQSRPVENCCWIRLPIIRWLAAAENVGCEERAERRDEDEEDAGGDAPGFAIGQTSLRMTATRSGIEVVGGLDQARIELLERRVDREDHEREARIDQTHEDRAIRIQEGDRRRSSDASARRRLVDEALVAQQQHPAIGPDQQVGPERDRHEKHQDLRASAAERVAMYQASGRPTRRQSPVARAACTSDRAKITR